MCILLPASLEKAVRGGLDLEKELSGYAKNHVFRGMAAGGSLT